MNVSICLQLKIESFLFSMSGYNITYNLVDESNYSLYDENDTYYNYNDENGDSVRDEMFEYVTEGVLLTSISVLGLIGNILAMYVLLRPSLRGIFSNILTGLASFDALFLATLPFTFGLPILSPYYRASYLYCLIFSKSIVLLFFETKFCEQIVKVHLSIYRTICLYI